MNGFPEAHPSTHGGSYGLSAEQVFPIYNRVGELRTAYGLSRKELADDLRMNHRTIGRLENGRCETSLREAFRIGRYFGLPLEMVFSTEPLADLPEELPELRRPTGGRRAGHPWRGGP